MPKYKKRKGRKPARKTAPRPRPRLVGISVVAERLHVTPRRIQQLVGEGLPRVTRGKYDVDHVLDWYIAKLERQLAGDGADDVTPGTLAKEELREKSARADLRELDVAKRRRELVAIVDVEKAMTDLVITTKARILSVPSRLAGELVGEASRVMVHAKIESALKDALAHLPGEASC